MAASLKRFDGVLEAKDKQGVPAAAADALGYVGDIEAALVKGFPFEVPQEYADLPQLKVPHPEWIACHSDWNHSFWVPMQTPPDPNLSPILAGSIRSMLHVQRMVNLSTGMVVICALRPCDELARPRCMWQMTA